MYGTTIIGNSLHNLHRLIYNLSLEKQNILLIGNRGTGKENFANFYRQEIGREKFMSINCSGLSEEALVSELFGHVEGSYTGASKDREGLLVESDKIGLIFLDEIGDASKKLQSMLLRVLETGDLKPLGSNKIINLESPLIIAATSKPEILRPDLGDRFISLYIPPLSERKEDIPDLIKGLWKQEDSQTKKPVYISKMALNKLKDHDWPGNVRELKKTLLMAKILCNMRNGKALRIKDFILFKDKSSDKSRRIKIDNLKGGEKVLSIKDFLKIPEKPVSSEKEEKPEKCFSIDHIFEDTAPSKYRALFWEHHAKKGRGGTKIWRMFQGESSTSTAHRQLKNAKERLKLKNNKFKKQ